MSIFNNNNNNNKYKTSWKTLKYALIVSLVTYLLLPHNNIIFFGVLHFITFSTFLMKNISSNISLTILIGILSVLLNNISFKYLGSSDIINLPGPAQRSPAQPSPAQHSVVESPSSQGFFESRRESISRQKNMESQRESTFGMRFESSIKSSQKQSNESKTKIKDLTV